MNTHRNHHLTDAEEHAILDAAISETRNMVIAEIENDHKQIRELNHELDKIKLDIDRCLDTGNAAEVAMLEDKRDDYTTRITELEEKCILAKTDQAISEYYTTSAREFKEYKNVPNNKGLLRCLKDKYPHFKRNHINARTNIDTVVANMCEIFESDSFKVIFNRYFDECESNSLAFYTKRINVFYKYCISKIRGVYKHAQALKTGFCNKQILNAYSEPNSISICITKNTLEANGQWLARFIKEMAALLRSQNPNVKTADTILIISSKKNKELKDVVTHCKDMNTAWGYLKRPNNNFKMVFICSNKTRIQDVLQMSVDFQNLRIGSDAKLRIIHDEAHNQKEGIPPYRDIVENIVRQPNVICYIPVTASAGTVACDNNPLWVDANLKKNSLNFISYDKTKSTDALYSACIDGKRITMEELRGKAGWKEHNVTCVSEEIFNNVHKGDLENADSRRRLEFCKFMENDCEMEAMNNGLNCLDMNNLLGLEYYQQNMFNLHILSTPRRKIITRFLAQEALTKNYRPIVLAIYGNEGDKYHLLYDNNETEVSTIMGSGEFNEKLDNLFTHLKEERVNIQRPFIIIGNYTPTGESLSYVNYKYGTVRGNIRLISTNSEDDYQQACRSNYMKTMFLRHDPTFVSPEKYLVGPAKYIANALWYETENDKLIDNLMARTDEDGTPPVLPPDTYHPQVDDAGGIIAIPVKIECDRTDPTVQQLGEIMMKDHRTPEDKLRFMQILKKCCEDDDIECSFTDPSGKFNFDFALNDFRCYKKKETPPARGQWKFKNYSEHHTIKTPFMNNKNNHKKGECELCSCMDYYVIRDAGTIIEQNPKAVFWIGYKY